MGLKSAEKTGVNEYTLEISIDGEAFEKSVNKIFNRNKNKITIPGFRKGKAPRNFIEKYYGENVFYDDALEDVFPAVYDEAVKEAAIDPVDSPRDFDIKLIGRDGVELVCLVTVKPEIKLMEYKGLSAVKQNVSVSADDVLHELSHMREDNARRIDIDDREVQNDDIVTMDFEGFVDGVPFDGGKSEDYELTIGSGQFIPGFEEQLIGHAAGEELEISVTFPEDYAEELAGKDAVFKIKLHSIQSDELPELDDEFAKDVSEFDTLDELKKNIEENLLKERQTASDEDFEAGLFKKLAGQVEGEIPDCMVEKELDNIISNIESNLRSRGLSLDMYLEYIAQTDFSSFRGNFRDEALENVKTGLALEKIVELENIDAGEDEVEAEYADMADKYHIEADKIREAVSAEVVKKDLASKKAVRLIVENAVAEEEQEPEEEEKPEEGKTEEKPGKKAVAPKPAGAAKTGRKKAADKTEAD